MFSHTHSGSRNLNPPKKIILHILNKFDEQNLEARVYPWMTVAELKQKLQRELGIPVAQQRLFMRGQELTLNNMSLLSYGIHNKNKLILRAPPMLKNTIGLIKIDETFPTDEALHQLVFGIQEGFNIGLVPKPTIEGTSGSYLLRNPSRKPIAIFKPIDEEPFAPNNPKGYKGKLGSQGFRKGVLSGESAAREVAAYLMDSKGFFGIPPTTFVEIVHHYFANREFTEPDIEADFKEMIPEGMTLKDPLIKHGSLQKYIAGAEEASDYGYGQFPDEEVRKIAIFDILMLNCDRNEGNILVKKERGRMTLVPIDHGLCLPDCIDICSYEITWIDWPQIRKPFNEVELEIINNLKPKEDALMLAKYLKFRDPCLRNFRISSTLLIKCAKEGMTISEIADLIYKDDPDLTSPLQDIIARADFMTETMRNSMSKDFLETLANSKKIRRRLSHKSKTLKDFSMLEGKLQSFIGRDGELINSFGGGNLRLGGKAHSDKPTSLEELLNSEDLLCSIPEEMDPAKEQQTTKDSTSDDEGSHEIYETENKSKPESKPRLTRNASMPDLQKLLDNSSTEINSQKELEEKKEESKVEVPKPKLAEFKIKPNNKNIKAKNETPSYLDELFFYYFEELLSRKIENILEKKRSKPKPRARFMSEGSY